jgi:hypothetical protein
MKALGILPGIGEQVPLYGRVKIDLLVGRVAIEIKALGSFGDDAKKYSGYRTKVEQKGWVYCYLTRGETYRPYRLATEEAFGKERNIGVTSSFLTEVKNEDAIPLLFMHVSLSFLLFFGFTDMLFIRIFRICKYN